jgi:hypothetical protein
VRAAAALLAAALLGGCLHGGDDADRNARILADLPAPAGANRVDVESAAYYDEEGGPPKGHTTTATYRAPPGTTDEEVVDFYAARLRGWRCRREDVGALLLHCTRGAALVSVNTENMVSDPPRFEVVADHEGARNEPE